MYNAMISPSPSSGPVLASFASAHTPEWLRSAANLPEMGVEYDAAGRVLWQIMRPQGKPSITRGLLCDALIVMDAVAAAPKTAEGYPVAYMVLASGVPGVYNLGGDLALFRQLIVERDAAALTSYAHTCDALGGGFEAALAHDVIVAERSAKFGLPEILFNLFPGMGAYTFLRRRLSPVMAERLMTSGRLYSAEELLDMGVIDMVAEDGAGAEAVRAYIRAHRRAGKSRMAVTRARDIANPVSHRELLGITDLWVETALTLTSQDLRKMDHLVAAQKRRMAA
jgi:DSF synthase